MFLISWSHWFFIKETSTRVSGVLGCSSVGVGSIIGFITAFLVVSVKLYMNTSCRWFGCIFSAG